LDFKQSPDQRPDSRCFGGVIVLRSLASGVYTQSVPEQVYKQDAISRFNKLPLLRRKSACAPKCNIVDTPLPDSPARLSQPANRREKSRKSGSGRQLALSHPIRGFPGYIRIINLSFKQSLSKRPDSRYFGGAIVWQSLVSGVFTQSAPK